MEVAETKTVAALVTGGEANAGPPLGPSLGPLGVNVMAIVKEINDKTKDYAGMRVPVKINVDTETKQFSVEVGVPTAAALIVKEASALKGASTPKSATAGNLSIAQLAKIANAKKSQSYGASTKAVAKEIVGTCVSMGITIEGEDPRQVAGEIDAGKWDKDLRD
jgi:large subunit ribosomal protein L11